MTADAANLAFFSIQTELAIPEFHRAETKRHRTHILSNPHHCFIELRRFGTPQRRIWKIELLLNIWSVQNRHNRDDMPRPGIRRQLHIPKRIHARRNSFDQPHVAINAAIEIEIAADWRNIRIQRVVGPNLENIFRRLERRRNLKSNASRPPSLAHHPRLGDIKRNKAASQSR